MEQSGPILWTVLKDWQWKENKAHRQWWGNRRWDTWAPPLSPASHVTILAKASGVLESTGPCQVSVPRHTYRSKTHPSTNSSHIDAQIGPLCHTGQVLANVFVVCEVNVINQNIPARPHRRSLLSKLKSSTRTWELEGRAQLRYIYTRGCTN